MCSMCNIHSSYFYSASLSPLLLRGAPDTAWILCRSFMPKRHRQLQVKDLSKVPTWRLERDSNPRPFGRKVMNLPMSHHAHNNMINIKYLSSLMTKHWPMVVINFQHRRQSRFWYGGSSGGLYEILFNPIMYRNLR